MKRTASILAIAFALFLCGPIARSQGAPAAAKPSSETPPAKPNPDTLPVRTFYLSNVAQQYEANDIVSSIRNILPNNDRIYVVSSQNAIVVRGTPEDLALTQKVINDLDRPKKNYRLTYTVTEMDGSRQLGAQHYAMIAVSGQETVLKQGSKVPVATGSYSDGGKTPAGVQTQFTYIDVGMNFDATLTEMGDNAMLKSAVEQSSVPERTTIEGVQEPIVRATSLKGESLLTPGKPLVLGSMDVPGSTSRLQIEVTMEPLP